MQKIKSKILNSVKNHRLSMSSPIGNSLSLELASWCSPTDDCDVNYSRRIRDLSKGVKQELYKLLNKQTVFNPTHSIVNFSIKNAGMNPNKKSYCNCSIILFIKKEVTNIDYVKNRAEELLVKIVEDVLEKSRYFMFTSRK